MPSTFDPLACRALDDFDMRVIAMRMRDRSRGRNVAELLGFDATGRLVSCRLLGHTIHGTPVSTPSPRERSAAYLLRGCTSLNDIAVAVAARHLWTEIAAMNADGRVA